MQAERTLTSYTNPLRGVAIIFWVTAIAIIIIYAMTCAYNSHAVEKHGTDAELVRRCLENNDPLQVWVKMTDGRVILICRVSSNKYGVQVRDPSGTREITSFIKNKMTRLSQVEKWLRNLGAERIYYP